MITPPPDRAVRYYSDPLINGFVVMVGDDPFILTSGPVVAAWSDLPEAVRHGWKIKGVQIDGSVIFSR